jgi:transposase
LSRLHHLLLELVPGGAKQFLSAPQARALLNTVRPRDIVGRTRRQLASELITEVAVIDNKIKVANQQLTELVESIGSTSQQLYGIGPCGAVRLLGDTGDISRFASRDHFASWNGTAPIDASSGDQHRHRLSAPETGASTGSCTSWPSSNCATTPKPAPTTAVNSQRARARRRPCGVSNTDCPMWSVNR